MTLEKILAAAKTKLDDDGTLGHRWSDANLTIYANEAQREASRRAQLIVDKTTSTYCRFELVPGTSLYTLDPKVLNVRNAYIGASLTADTISWDATTYTLSDSGSGFLDAGFEEDTQITIEGFTESENNGLFSATSVTAGDIVVSETTMTTEAAGDDVTIRTTQLPLAETTRALLDEAKADWQTDKGEPTMYIKESGTELLFYPIPDKANTVSMVVTRLPASDMIAGTSPEIPEKYHYALVYWICKLAFEMNDSNKNTLEKAIYYDKLFSDTFGSRPSAIAESFKRRNPRMGRMRWKQFGF